MFIDFSDKSLYNNKYIPIMHNKKRYVLLMGGGGSGKSTFQAQNEIIKTFSGNRRLLCIRKVKDTCKDSVFSELTGVIEEWGLSQYFDITRSPLSIKNKLTGSDILFRGIDDPEKIKSIRRVSRVWIEEATELDREDFNQIDLRLRGQTDMQIICTFNPIDQEHWLNLDLWQHGSTDNVECLHTTFLDNRWVGVEYRDVMERLRIQDPRMYEIYALGKWGSRVEGIIFDKWTEIDTVPEGARELGYGLDFGYTNDPTALINGFISDNAIILDEVLYRTKMTNGDIINIFKSEEIDSRDDIFGDSAEPKSIEDIYRAGFNIKPVLKGPDSIQYGIDILKSYEIKVTKRSLNLKKELNNYCWAKDKNGVVGKKPIDSFNHAIDAARYLAIMALGKPKLQFKVY